MLKHYWMMFTEHSLLIIPHLCEETYLNNHVMQVDNIVKFMTYFIQHFEAQFPYETL